MLIYFVSFPDNSIQELKELYASNFDKVYLKKIKHASYTTQIKKKTIEEVTNIMKRNNLYIVFSVFYKLAELVLTFPSTTAPAERRFNSLKKIKT